MLKAKVAVAVMAAATVFIGVTSMADAAPKPRYWAALGAYTTPAAGVITNAGVTADAKLEVHGDHVTVTLKADGLTPGKTYPAHIHVGHCTDYGPHFKYDTTVSSAVESNEIWLSLTARNDGKADDKVDRPVFDTTQPLSIVIHEDSTNPAPLRRIACGNFAPNEPRYRSEVGAYSAPATGVITDAGVTGEAKLRVKGDHVTVTLKADGLTPGKTYPAHIHVGHCTDYGPHFKYDTTVSSAVESNEIWLSLTARNDGKADDKVDRPVFDTTQPLSIVIHEDSTNPAPLRRIACGDFTPEHV